MQIINGYMALRFSALLVVLMLAFSVGACAQDDDAPSAATQHPGMARPSSAASAPPLQGFGAQRAQSAPSDTIDLRDIGYSRGAVDAPVVVYEFSDFGCPFCSMFAQGTYPQLHEEFVETGKVRWTYVPFVMGMFPNGAEAARAAECAGEQEEFWAMHDLLFDRQDEWKSSRSPVQLFNGYAAELGLDEERFESCYREDRGGARTEINNSVARALRVRATPSFFINGRLVEGALPLEQFRQILTMLAGAGSGD
ncbi:MAG TPA: thioredoxin domain-containing protein [Longimicrobiaceae bacterium]|nr:thioredoxin domain-containing protein [Longimicrobiaceae bacterium]